MSTDLLAATKDALSSKLEDYCTEIVQLIEPLKDQQLWQKPVDPGNSAGHLILHLTGNLNHFIGAQLGHTGYVRDREREFTDAKPPAKALVEKNLKEAVALVPPSSRRPDRRTNDRAIPGPQVRDDDQGAGAPRVALCPSSGADIVSGQVGAGRKVDSIQ